MTHKIIDFEMYMILMFFEFSCILRCMSTNVAYPSKYFMINSNMLLKGQVRHPMSFTKLAFEIFEIIQTLFNMIIELLR